MADQKPRRNNNWLLQKYQKETTHIRAQKLKRNLTQNSGKIKFDDDNKMTQTASHVPSSPGPRSFLGETLKVHSKVHIQTLFTNWRRREVLTVTWRNITIVLHFQWIEKRNANRKILTSKDVKKTKTKPSRKYRWRVRGAANRKAFSDWLRKSRWKRSGKDDKARWWRKREGTTSQVAQ